MKLLVCVSKTPDTTAKISFTNADTEFNPAGVTFIMNPYDEWYALVRALELKEKFGGKVTIISVGPATNAPIINKGLAIGADDAIHVVCEPSSSLFVAKQIAAHAEGYDIVFCGKETIDYNGSEVGGMLAELLDQPFVSYASSLEMEGNTATIHRDIEGGKEIVEVDTPFVVSAAKGLAEQRIPNMRGIMMARRKPVKKASPVEVADLSKVVRYELPAEKADCKMLDPENMDELVRLLHEESKVL